MFGRIERGSGECFLVEVEKQDAATLLPLISQHVRPRSTVLSDEWSSYNQLTATTGNIHLTVNHLLHFVDPTTGAYTQSVEGIWSCCKRMMREEKVMHCTSGPHMLGNKGKQGCSILLLHLHQKALSAASLNPTKHPVPSTTLPRLYFLFPNLLSL